MGSILLERFKDLTFTKGQNRIAQYMIDHEINLCRMSLMDVSKAVGVSDASVLRFVRYIGFDGYNDFKEQLYQKLTEQAELAAGNGKPRLKDRMNSDSGIAGGAQLQDMAARLGESTMDSLMQNDPRTFENFADVIRSARIIYVHGTRGTLAVAEHFSRCLRFLFGNVVFLSSGHDAQAALCNASSKDCFVFFCASRFYEGDLHICEAARSADVPICLITNSIPSPLTPFAEQILVSKAIEQSFFNSIVGMVGIAEYLLDLLSQGQKDTLSHRLDSFDYFTREERCR